MHLQPSPTVEPRTSLGGISSNTKTKGKELTPYLRGQICAERRLGLSYATIGHNYNLSRSTVYKTVKLESQRQDGISLKRSGRTKLLNERDKRAVIRVIKCNPVCSYKEIREQSGTTACDMTLLSTIRAEGYHHWKTNCSMETGASTHEEWYRYNKIWSNISTFSRTTGPEIYEDGWIFLIMERQLNSPSNMLGDKTERTGRPNRF